MSYFLKVTEIKKGTYLQIYESKYDPKKGYSVNTSFQTLGYLTDLVSDKIKDPIAHYKKVVAEMNRAEQEQKLKAKREEIGEVSELNVGHFLINSLFERFDISHELNLIAKYSGYHFDMDALLKALVSARIIDPCSKQQSLHHVFPSLYGDYRFSDYEMYRGLEFLGEEHEDIIQMINAKYQKRYGRKTEKVYFDATNFYFEIDREDDLRRKGPSKEGRHDPIVGMGLLLDEDQIPLAVSFFPGNESEIPELPKTITKMKERYKLTGKTVQVADKGLNCTNNIIKALKNGDGYLFSQSVKKLPELEKKWILNEHDWVDVCDRHGNLLYRYKTWTDDFPYTTFDQSGKKFTGKLTQKRMVTYNPSLAKKQLAELNKMVEKILALNSRAALKSEYGDAKKYVDFIAIEETGEIADDIRVKAIINEEKLKADRLLLGYNLLVTSETKMKAEQMYKTYHTLWRIEETFRILKSNLETRPVYVQNKNSIYGHFLANYLAVFFLRVLQIKVFNEEFNVNDIIKFIKNFKVTKVGNEYLNLSRRSVVEPIANYLKIDILSRKLSPAAINNLMKKKI